MNFKQCLIRVAKETLNEGVESSKEMIQNNLVPSFEDMGMANVNPGEFAQSEITDRENLVNKASMSNDNDFNSEEGPKANTADAMTDLVDISMPDAVGVKAVKVIKTAEEDEQCSDDPLKALFGESTFTKIVKKVLFNEMKHLNLKEREDTTVESLCDTFLINSSEKHLLEESEWAGPKDFVPDTRINVSDVLQVLKNEIGEGSEGIHVDQLYDAQKNNVYKVSQIDKKKLPKKITVGSLILELKDDEYIPSNITSEFPMQK